MSDAREVRAVIAHIRQRLEARHDPPPHMGTCLACGQQQPVNANPNMAMASGMAAQQWVCAKCHGQISVMMTINDGPTADDDIESLLALLADVLGSQTPGTDNAGEVTRARICDRIRKAVLESTPDSDPFDDPESNEYWRGFNACSAIYTRALIAVQQSLICPTCGAPAHRGDAKAKLDALLPAWVTPALNASAEVVSPLPSDEAEMRIRRYLWLSHGHTGVYGDDGEMQCGQCIQFGAVDYKREPLDRLIAAIEQACHARMVTELSKAAEVVSQPKQEEKR